MINFAADRGVSAVHRPHFNREVVLADVACPHCGALNPDGSAFCESCGKALPTQPGVTLGYAGKPGFTTTSGRALLGEDYKKVMRRAFGALLVVAILQTLFGPVALYLQKSQMEKQNPGMVYEIQPWAYAMIFGIAVVFWVLAFWARKSPLPAAITGLVVFITVHALDAIADPTTLARGFVMKIIVIVTLASAIKAGIEYRKLQAEAA